MTILDHENKYAYRFQQLQQEIEELRQKILTDNSKMEKAQSLIADLGIQLPKIIDSAKAKIKELREFTGTPKGVVTFDDALAVSPTWKKEANIAADEILSKLNLDVEYFERI